jgi:hypothetical protein
MSRISADDVYIHRLAYFELRSVLARMIWHFEIELDKESRAWMDDPKEFAVWDKPPLWVGLKHRDSSCCSF